MACPTSFGESGHSSNCSSVLSPKRSICSNVPVDDISDRAEATKHHECNIDAQVLELPAETDAVENFVDRVGELVAVPARDKSNDRSVPEEGSRGMDSGNDVDGADEENTLYWSRERGQVERTSVELLPAETSAKATVKQEEHSRRGVEVAEGSDLRSDGPPGSVQVQSMSG